MRHAVDLVGDEAVDFPFLLSLFRHCSRLGQYVGDFPRRLTHVFAIFGAILYKFAQDFSECHYGKIAGELQSAGTSPSFGTPRPRLRFQT
jgi:hypothetical protein